MPAMEKSSTAEVNYEEREELEAVHISNSQSSMQNETFHTVNRVFSVRIEALPVQNEASKRRNVAFPVGNEVLPIANEAFPVGNEAFEAGNEGLPRGNRSFPVKNKAFRLTKAQKNAKNAVLIEISN